MKYTLTFGITRWEAAQKVMAANLTGVTHKIAIQLHLVAESCTICSSRSRRPVRKLLDTPSYCVPLLCFIYEFKDTTISSSSHFSSPQSPFCNLTVRYLVAQQSSVRVGKFGWPGDESWQGQGREFFSSPPHPGCLWYPPSLPYPMGMKLTSHLHLALRLRTHGAIPPLPYVFMALCLHRYTFIYEDLRKVTSALQSRSQRSKRVSSSGSLFIDYAPSFSHVLILLWRHSLDVIDLDIDFKFLLLLSSFRLCILPSLSFKKFYRLFLSRRCLSGVNIHCAAGGLTKGNLGLYHEWRL
jgi:hypothetical protein